LIVDMNKSSLNNSKEDSEQKYDSNVADNDENLYKEIKIKNKKVRFENCNSQEENILDTEPEKFEEKLKKIRIRMSVSWEEDEKVNLCNKCGQEFGFFKRKHHCRACGKIFCQNHCKRWIMLPQMYYFKDPERTCDDCWKLYSGIDFKRSFDTFGPKEASTIILLHGSLSNRTQLVYQIEILSKQYRILSLDLPGHGSRIDEKLTSESAIRAISEIIENEVQDKKATIFGYDLGGFVAIQFAKIHPEMCRLCSRSFWRFCYCRICCLGSFI
jgi:hypothetical protein